MYGFGNACSSFSYGTVVLCRIQEQH